MALPKDEEILDKFHNFRLKFTDGWRRERWIQSEVRENYSAVDGFSYGDGTSGQWENLDYIKRINDGKPMFQINKLARVVDSIAGFQIQNRSEIRYIPREVETQSQQPQPNQPPQAPMMGDSSKLADVVNDGIEYIKNESRCEAENSAAYADMLTCGIGAVDSVITYDEDDDGIGQPSARRVAPYLLMWDVAARKKNLTDANAVASASLHDRETLLEEINADRPKGEKIAMLPNAAAADRFLWWFCNDRDNLVAAYDFQWRVKEAYWQVQNPFVAQPGLIPFLQESGALTIATSSGVDLASDSVFNIDIDEKKAVQDVFTTLGLEFKALKQRRYRYYRANIVGDIVVSKSDNYSQKGFSLSFMTGKWSETRQCWYGPISLAKDPQRLLNKCMSDISETMYISPHGGVAIEAGAITGGASGDAARVSLKDFKETWSKQREVTILADGAISGQKFMMKPQAQISPASMQMLQYAEQAVLEVVGITQEFLGVADGGGNQAAMLQAQRVKQGLAVLQTYADAYSFFLINQAKNHVEMLRVLSENSGGLIIRNLSGKGEQSAPYVKLLKDQIAIKYDLIVKESPKTPDEREKENDVLLQLMQLIQTSGGNPQPMIPLVIENQNIDSDKLDKILAATQPPPPPQPDPVNQALLQAQAASLLADAKYKESQTKTNDFELLQNFKDFREGNSLDRDKLKADIAQTVSNTILNLGKAAATNAQVQNEYVTTMNSIMQPSQPSQQDMTQQPTQPMGQ